MVYHQTTGLIYTSPQIGMKVHPASSGIHVVSTSSTSDVVAFLDQDDHYKSVATKIPHDVLSALVRPSKIEPRTTATQWLCLFASVADINNP